MSPRTNSNQFERVILVLVAIFGLELVKPVLSHDCPQDNFLQVKELQIFRLRISWAHLDGEKKNLSDSEVEALISKRLKRTLVGGTSIESLSLARRQESVKLVEEIDSIIDLKPNEKEGSLLLVKLFGSEYRVAADLLRSLNNLVDCRRSCQITTYNTQAPHEQNPTSAGSFHFEPAPDSQNVVEEGLLIVGKIWLLPMEQRNGSQFTNESCSYLCAQISLSLVPSEESVISEVFVKLNSYLLAFFSLLDPHHWLVLVVGVWLTTCFIIAMLIKRRDKRRLRLHLEARADYSFSTKR